MCFISKLRRHDYNSSVLRYMISQYVNILPNISIARFVNIINQPLLCVL